MGVALPARKESPTAGAIHLSLRLIAVLVLLWVAWNVLLAAGRGRFSDVVTTTPGLILLAACFYALGQFMRIVRLALLVGNARLSLRHLASLHLFTAGVALGTPLRLGDLYRATELGKMTGGLIMGFTLVWIERLFDAAFILPVLLVEASSTKPGGGAAYAGIAGFTLLFVAGSVLLVALLPDNLRRVGTYLIRRHDGEWTIRTLRIIDDTRAALRRIPDIVRGRAASLAALTMLVWFFEISGFSVVMLAWRPGVDPLGGLLAFLSQTTAGGTLPDMLGDGAALVPAEIAYLAASQVPLAIIAIIAALYYALASLRRKRS